MAKTNPTIESIIPRVRFTWNYDRRAMSRATGLKCDDPSLAVQSQEAEANINNIVRNFGVTGKLPASIRQPMYGDFTEVYDYRSAFDAVKAAEAAFAALPSDLRARLKNDPQAFLEYCANPANLEELRKLGLAVSAPSDLPPAAV